MTGGKSQLNFTFYRAYKYTVGLAVSCMEF
jgi:hypothetical protein